MSDLRRLLFANQTRAYEGYPLVISRSVALRYLKQYQMYGNSEQGLPAEYTQLEYLGSDSQAYINTGIAGGKTTFEIGVKFSYSSFVAYGAIYGNYVADSYRGERCILADQSGKIITNNETTCTITGNTELTCAINDVHTLISKNTEVTLDGVTTVITHKAQGTANSGNIALFNRSITNPNTSRDIGLKVYAFYIKDSDTLVSNLIPCKRNSDNVLGMYDTVSGQFFTNAGSGTFTAGPALPTPANPVEVISVGDKTVNLLNRPNGTYSSDGKGSVTVLNNITTVNVQFTTNWTIYKLTGGVDSTNITSSLAEMKTRSTDDVFFKSGHTYIVKLFDSTDNYYDLQIANTTTNIQIRNGEAFTPTEDFNTLWVRMSRDGSGSQTGNKTFKIMIIEGSTAPTSYVPYGYQIPVVAQVKNLFDGGERGDYSGTTGEKTGSTAKYRSKNKIPVIAGQTYTNNIIDKPSWATFTQLNVFGYNEQGTLIWVKNAVSTGNHWVVGEPLTMPQNTAYITFSTFGSTVNTDERAIELDGKFVIVEGSVAPTSYVPYGHSTTPIYLNAPLRKVGTYVDVLDYKKGQIIRNVGVKVLDGTENWVKGSSAIANYSFWVDVSSLAILQNRTILCSHFQSSSTLPPATLESRKNKIWRGTSDIEGTRASVCIGYNFDTAGVANFKAFLAAQYAAGTPVVIYYPLATPVTESIVAPALPTLAGSTTYTTETEVKPSNMKGVF